jgi:hypothetical protein
MMRSSVCLLLLLLSLGCTLQNVDFLSPSSSGQSPLPISTPFPAVILSPSPAISLSSTPNPLPIAISTPICLFPSTSDNLFLQGDLGPLAIQGGIGYIPVGSQLIVFDTHRAQIVSIVDSNLPSLVGPIEIGNKN